MKKSNDKLEQDMKETQRYNSQLLKDIGVSDTLCNEATDLLDKMFLKYND